MRWKASHMKQEYSFSPAEQRLAAFCVFVHGHQEAKGQKQVGVNCQ